MLFGDVQMLRQSTEYKKPHLKHDASLLEKVLRYARANNRVLSVKLKLNVLPEPARVVVLKSRMKTIVERRMMVNGGGLHFKNIYMKY